MFVLIGLSALLAVLFLSIAPPRGEDAQTIAAPPEPVLGQLAPDLKSMNPAIKPGNDFYGHVNGGWLAKAVIFAVHSEIGAYRAMSVTAHSQAQSLLRAAGQKNSKIAALFLSYMDKAQVQAKGLSPLAPTLAKLQSVNDRSALVALMAALQREGVAGLFAAFISADSHDPSAYTVYLEQNGLGLPDTHFYIDTDKASVAGRNAYLDYATKLLTLAAEKDAALRAASVMVFEAQIARAQWSDVQGRDQTKTDNRFTPAQLEALAGSFDWSAYLAGLGLSSQPFVIIREPSAFTIASSIWAAASVPVLKDWLLIRYLDQRADYLPQSFVDAHFAFHGAAMSGVARLQPRPLRGAALVSRGS